MSKTSLEIFIKNLLNRQKLYIQNKKQLIDFLDNNLSSDSNIKTMKELSDDNFKKLSNIILNFKNINKMFISFKFKSLEVLKSTDLYSNIYSNIKLVLDNYKNKDYILNIYKKLFLLNYSTILEKADIVFDDIKNNADKLSKQASDNDIDLKLVKNIILFLVPSIYLILSIFYFIELPLNIYNSTYDFISILHKVISNFYILLLQKLSYIYNIIISTIQFFLFLIQSYLNSVSIFRVFKHDNSILSLVELFISVININQLLFVYLIVYSILTYNVVRFFILKSHLFNVNFYNNSNSVFLKNYKDKKFYNIWTYIYEDES
jgi:hypothetical protein